jgi:DNA-binding MarR family transcriptional regulator
VEVRLMSNLSKNDYKVLYVLEKHECTNEMKSFTISKISESTGLSISKIRITLREFIKLGYIKEGAVNHTAKTYYITKEGIDKVKSLV